MNFQGNCWLLAAMLFLSQPVVFFLSCHGAFFNSLGKTLFFGALLLATGGSTGLTAI